MFVYLRTTNPIIERSAPDRSYDTLFGMDTSCGLAADVRDHIVRKPWWNSNPCRVSGGTPRPSSGHGPPKPHPPTLRPLPARHELRPGKASKAWGLSYQGEEGKQ